MKQFLRRLFTWAMVGAAGLCLFSTYTTFKFISSAYPVIAKVLKTDRADRLVVDVPTELDIGKPYAGAITKHSSYHATISYPDPVTKATKTMHLPTLKEYKPGEELPVLVSKSGAHVLQNSFLGRWGSSFLFLLGAILFGFFRECLEDVKTV